MNLLPADIILIKRGTAWMPFAPAIWLWQRIADPTTPWSWAYHVEMVWEPTEDGYKAFSLQPPVLSVVKRATNEVQFSAYRLKNRSDDLTEKFWKWGNLKILHQPYILGWSTCGHPVRDFYKLDCTPYPGPIEDVCKHSGEFVRVR